MNFSQSLSYLNSFYDLEKTMRLPAPRRWKLERMRHLLMVFGQPQKSFIPIIIVGTKGKGSTGFFLQSILRQAGIPSGFYSSPHLESPRERIRVNGKMISKPLWCRLLQEIKKKLTVTGRMTRYGEYTYFEIMTLLAALAFKEIGARAAVFEAGLGGRLDAVNALGSSLVIVTPIHLDHQEFLGRTLSLIAAEKAAVIHRKADVIMAPQTRSAREVIQARVKQQKARLWAVTHKIRGSLGLQGEHQAWNAAAAVLASQKIEDALNANINRLERQGHGASEKNLPSSLVRISKTAVKKGLKAKDWPGRYEILTTRPRVILDGAHNPAAIQALVQSLKQNPSVKRNGILVFAVTRDKDSLLMLKILARVFTRIVLVPLDSARGKSVGELIQEARPYFRVLIPSGNITEALKMGKLLAGTHGTVVVTGSFYLVGAARARLKKERKA